MNISLSWRTEKGWKEKSVRTRRTGCVAENVGVVEGKAYQNYDNYKE